MLYDDGVANISDGVLCWWKHGCWLAITSKYKKTEEEGQKEAAKPKSFLTLFVLPNLSNQQVRIINLPILETAHIFVYM